MELQWWHWLIMGFLGIGMELLIPCFTVIWFGLGAILVSIILAVFSGFPLWGQILTWTAASVAFALLWFKGFNTRPKPGRIKVGETGIIIAVHPDDMTGIVKFHLPLNGWDEWECRANVPLLIGDRVRLVTIGYETLEVEK